jgi:2-oxo-3-hexenedioate decarboxylase
MDATKLAAELIELHDHPRAAEPFSARYPGLTADSGYAAARQLHAHRLAQGWQPAGRKIGFTNRTIWPRYGVYEPIWGHVYDRTLSFAKENRATVSLAGLVQPRIEPEIAFKLKSAPPLTRDPSALLACIEWAAHSVEIVHCYHPDWKLQLPDSTAANGLHGRLVVGAPVPVEKISGLAAALPFLKIALFKGEEQKDQGLGSNVLGSPLLALAFLVELLSKQEGAEKLAAGEIISTGTITDAHPVAPGERWRTDLHGFALRNLEITFT